MQTAENFMNLPQEPIANVEAEQGLLGAILCQPETLHHLPLDFDAEHFYEPLHSSIYQQIRHFSSAGEPYDLFTLARYFDKENVLKSHGGAKLYLSKLAQFSVTVTNAPALAKLIIDLAERRKIVALCQETIAKAALLSEEITAGEIAAGVSSSLENLSTATRFRISTERQVTERLVTLLQENKSIPSSPTGITKLDFAMDGGMYAGKLYGIVGRKKMGKTMLAGTISHNLQNSGVKHMYLALEMGSDEIHQRSLAREIGCKEAVFRLGINDSLLLKMADYATKTKNNRLYLDAPCLSFDDLRHILPQYIRKHKIKGFILDCWQLVGGKPRGQSTSEHLDAVAQWLAECCKKYKVWGLVTAQENQDENTRGGEGIRLACDQLYRICKKDECSPEAWIEMMETRYTRWKNVGGEFDPSLIMHDNGTHYEQL